MRFDKIVLFSLAGLIQVGIADAHEIDVTPTRQSVMIGPFPDGRVVWCKGREDENGELVIADADASSCRMDTSDVKPPAPLVIDTVAPHKR